MDIVIQIVFFNKFLDVVDGGDRLDQGAHLA